MKLKEFVDPARDDDVTFVLNKKNKISSNHRKRHSVSSLIEDMQDYAKTERKKKEEISKGPTKQADQAITKDFLDEDETGESATRTKIFAKGDPIVRPYQDKDIPVSREDVVTGTETREETVENQVDSGETHGLVEEDAIKSSEKASLLSTGDPVLRPYQATDLPVSRSEVDTGTTKNVFGEGTETALIESQKMVTETDDDPSPSSTKTNLPKILSTPGASASAKKPEIRSGGAAKVLMLIKFKKNEIKIFTHSRLKGTMEQIKDFAMGSIKVCKILNYIHCRNQIAYTVSII